MLLADKVMNTDYYQKLKRTGNNIAKKYLSTHYECSIAKGIPMKYLPLFKEFSLKVKGLSMIDAGIHEDDLVAIKKTTDVKNGDLVVVRLEDEVTLKYFKKKDHLLQLIPANKDFSTIEIDLREQEAFVEGKSVGLIRTH